MCYQRDSGVTTKLENQLEQAYEVHGPSRKRRTDSTEDKEENVRNFRQVCMLFQHMSVIFERFP